MENPLWHDSLVFERMLQRRRKSFSGHYAIRLTHEEVEGPEKQLELMRLQLPPA